MTVEEQTRITQLREEVREWSVLAEALGAMLAEPRPYHNARGYGVWKERKDALLKALDEKRSLEPELEMSIMAVEVCNAVIFGSRVDRCTKRRGHDGHCMHDPLIAETRLNAGRSG